MMRRGIGRVGRPSLIGTAARTAVVAGTAGAVVHHQQAKYADRDAAAQQQAYEQQQSDEAAQAPPPPPAAEEKDTVTQLRELAELHEQGILTDDEFAAQKAKILG